MRWPCEIPPSDVLVIDAVLKVGGEEDKTTYLDVQLAEPDNLSFKLILRANVREQMSLSARMLEFGSLDSASTKEATQLFEVHNYSDKDWDSLVVLSNCDWCRVTTLSTPLESESSGRSPRQTWKYRCDVFREKLSPEKNSSSVAIVGSKNSTIVAEKSLAVTVHRSPDVDVQPHRLFFGTIPFGETVSRRLIVQSRDSKTILSLRNVCVSVPDGFAHFLSAKIETVVDGGAALFISVSVRHHIDEDIAKTLAGQLRVTFPNTSLPEIVVPFAGDRGL